VDSLGIQRDSKGFLNGKMSWPWPTFPVLVFRWAGHVLYAMVMAHIVFFAKSINIHLPFEDLGSLGMSIGPPIWIQRDLYWDSLSIVVRLLKELMGF